MPIIKSAKKKLRKDRKREVINRNVRGKLKSLIKKVRKNPSVEGLREIYSALDKAAKAHLYHRNKSGRLKSRLSNLVHSSKPL